MKKNFIYALMSAIALTGAVGFSACSSSDELADVNPTFDGEKVKTAFTISVGDVTSPTTRMGITAVQGEPTPVFRGMTNIYLFPFKSAITASTASTTTIDESYIHLAEFSDFSSSVENAKGRIYNDVSLSVGVNNFLFYGATLLPGNGKLKPSYLELTDASWKGSTTWAPSPINKGATKVSDLTFDLVPIKKGWTLADVKTSGATTIAPLNAAYKAIADQISAATTATHTAVVTELEKIQTTLQNNQSTGTTPATAPKAYAGSSESIKSLMQMLYATLKNQDAVLTVGSGTEAVKYGKNITDVLDTYFDANADGTTGEWTLEWKSGSDPTFPATTLGVPDGAVAVQYVDGNAENAKFEYVTPSVDGLAVAEISRYTYPACLYYTVNTPSMVKNAEYLKTNNNDDNDTWAKVKTAGGYATGAVAPDTRSVIMEDQVQYGVGRLDVNVKVKPSTIIEDNSKDAPQPVTVPSDGYQLTGVLIGGQKQVGWDFTPIESATDMTIWDNTMASTIYAKQQESFNGPNYTLALETKASSSINIALEFLNTGNDFCGVDHNLIPHGTKFYLVANLNPNTNTSYKVQDPDGTTPDGAALINQVIKQDYVTTVYLTIGANSLKRAYNVVPDLRSPKLEFGLSVDLMWRTGITFDVEFPNN